MKVYVKKMFYIILIVFSFFCVSKTVLKQKTDFVFADSTQILNDEDGIADTNLYNALLWDNYNVNLPASERLEHISKDMFKDYEVLNLSGFNIETLIGLDLLNLSSLKEIYLSHNSLQVINEDVLEVLKDVEILDLSYNNFEYAYLSTFDNATNINLSYNNLQEADLTSLKENVYVNLLSNNFSSLERITVDENKVYNINLTYNKIEEITDHLNGCNVDYYFQNIFGEEITTQDSIKIYSGYSMPNFNIHIINSDFDTIDTISVNEEVSLNVGQFYLKFFDGSTPLYNGEDDLTFAFKDINLTVKPQKVSVKYFVNNEEVEYSNMFSKNVTLKFSALDGGKIMVSINGKDFVEKDEVTITEENANYIIAKNVVDGIESNNTVVLIHINKPLPLPTSLIFILSALGFVIIFLAFKFYANKPVNFNGKKDTNENN